MIAEMVKEMPLADAVNAANRAETLGPLLDPTLSIQKRKALSEDKEMLEALWGVQQEVIRIVSRREWRESARE